MRTLKILFTTGFILLIMAAAVIGWYAIVLLVTLTVVFTAVKMYYSAKDFVNYPINRTY